jgi:hypothetical protein
MGCQPGSAVDDGHGRGWRTVALAVAVVGFVACRGNLSTQRPEALVRGEAAGRPANASPAEATTTTTPPLAQKVRPPVARAAERPEDAASRFVAEYVTHSWREPAGSAAVRAAAYATPAFARELIAGTRPYAGWSGVIERREDARGIVEAAYGDSGHGAAVTITVLVRVEVRSISGMSTSRRAIGVQVESAGGGWLVGGMEQ